MNAVEREGGDITAADMVNAATVPSLIEEYFDDAVVFVTGASGFVGKLVVEKLLRACKVRQVYVLMRPKRGKSVAERFGEYFDDVVFERLKREDYGALQKVVAIGGDCAMAELGVNAEVLRRVSCVFHCASTGCFEDEFVPAVLVNVGGVKELLRLCRKMPELRSVVCMSSVYAHCVRREINEVFYDVHLSGDDLLALVAILKTEMSEDVASVVIGDWPNVYTFTKAVAEDVIKRESDKLPVGIVRPSLVIGTAKEPVSGWVDSFYGASGLFAGISLGLIRTMHLEPNNLADLVPADYVVNCMLAASYDVALKRSINVNEEMVSKLAVETVPIYNYTSTPQRPISWRSALEMVLSHIEQVPLSFQIWHAILIPTKHLFVLLQYLLHFLPEHVISLNKNARFYSRRFLDAFAYFTSQQWIIRNACAENLRETLNETDRKCFEFDMRSFDWDLYFRTCVRGLRVYLLKDPIETIPAGERRQKLLKLLHYGLLSSIAAAVCALIFKTTKF